MHFLSIHNSNAFGGAERYTADLLLGLSDKGHTVSLCASPGSPVAQELRDTRVHVEEVAMGPPIGWHAVLGALNGPLFWADLYMNPAKHRLSQAIKRIHSRRPADVLHVQFIKERLWAGSLAHDLDLPVVWTIHSPLEPWMLHGAPARVARRTMESVAAVIAVSHATADSIIGFGVDPDKVSVVYNGVDASFWNAGDRVGARMALGLEQQLMVLVPARPYVEKGINILLDALEKLDAQTLSQLRVLVAGDSGHIPTFRADVQRRGLNDSVTFLGHRTDMQDLYAAADVVCLPSLYEGLPYAISEAMAAGKPVIGTMVGGVPEMIEDGVTGLLVNRGDSSGLAVALDALTDEELRSSMGLEAKTRASGLFSMGAMLRKTEHVIESALQDHRRQANTTDRRR